MNFKKLSFKRKIHTLSESEISELVPLNRIGFLAQISFLLAPLGLFSLILVWISLWSINNEYLLAPYLCTLLAVCGAIALSYRIYIRMLSLFFRRMKDMDPKIKSKGGSFAFGFVLYSPICFVLSFVLLALTPSNLMLGRLKHWRRYLFGLSAACLSLLVIASPFWTQNRTSAPYDTSIERLAYWTAGPATFFMVSFIVDVSALMQLKKHPPTNTDQLVDLTKNHCTSTATLGLAAIYITNESLKKTKTPEKNVTLDKKRQLLTNLINLNEACQSSLGDLAFYNPINIFNPAGITEGALIAIISHTNYINSLQIVAKIMKSLSKKILAESNSATVDIQLSERLYNSQIMKDQRAAESSPLLSLIFN